MELEKKTHKVIRTIKDNPRSQAHYASFSTKAIYISKEVCFFCGVLLIVLSLVGLVMDNFLGAHLTYLDNAINFALGALAITFGFYGRRVARIGSLALGLFYGALGIIGFFVGRLGTATVGNLSEDRFLWSIYPRLLEYGFTDHLIHIFFALAFVAGALTKSVRSQSGSITYH